MDCSHFEVIEEIYRKHSAFLLRVAVGCTRRPEDGEDLLFETFLLLLSGDVRLPVGVHPRQYLTGVIVKRARKLHRWTRVREDADPIDLPRPAVEPAPDDVAVANDLARRFVRRIARLPPRQRLVLTLYVEDQLTVTAIAERLQLARSTVTTHLLRAREGIRSADPDQ